MRRSVRICYRSPRTGLTIAQIARTLGLHRQTVLAEVYPADSIARAIADGLAFEAFSAEYIANILETRARTLPEPGPLQLTRGIDLLDIDIPPPDLTVYDGGSRDAE